MTEKNRMLDVKCEDGVTTVRFDREPKLNAFSIELQLQLAGALGARDVLSSDIIIFTGGPRVFSSGADVTELRGRRPEDVFEHYKGAGSVYRMIADLRQPTISAISGYCLGGGLELALATDFRVADESAVFGFPELDIGILPSSGGLERLVRTVGASRAKELTILRRQFNASQAFEAGLLTEIVVGSTPLEVAYEWAQKIRLLPRMAVQVTKQAAERMVEAPREVGSLIEQLAYGLLAQTDAHDQALASFSDKSRGRDV